jgi:hypothetical protein
MKPKIIKQSAGAAIESLKHGGRAGEKDLKEIADLSVVDLLSSGLTLEQAETVVRMAAIEIARISETARMVPKTPAVEVKIKKGKK